VDAVADLGVFVKENGSIWDASGSTENFYADIIVGTSKSGHIGVSSAIGPSRRWRAVNGRRGALRASNDILVGVNRSDDKNVDT
jgi:hypothetical protein